MAVAENLIMVNARDAAHAAHESAESPAAQPAEPSGHPRNADDRRWVKAVVEQHESGLMRFATQKLGGDEDLARDVVQDTFLKLWQADWDWVRSHLAQWLYTVCRNRCLDVRRKERRMTTFDATASDAHAGQPVASAHQDDPASSQFSHILQAMNALSEKQQDAVRLKFQCGLSYREIAGVMDITVNHVGVMLHQALKVLRDHVQPDVALAPVTPTQPVVDGKVNDSKKTARTNRPEVTND